MQLSEDVYYNRKKRALNRWESAKKFLNSSTCREMYLLDYFGQKSSPCGKCDICKEKQKIEVNDKTLIRKINLELNKNPLSVDELKIIFKNHRITQIQTILQRLILEEKIRYINGKYERIN